MASVIPENAVRFSSEELTQALGVRCSAFDGEVRGVWTDSRALRPGGLFVALRGDNFDGHRFVGAAVARGARVVVVEEPAPEIAGVVVLHVPSTLRALGDLARFHRRRWGGRVVGVAGSVGKTTTRSAAAAVLRATGQAVFSPQGNLNNRVGVPMVLLALGEGHGLAVVELGTSVLGEIAALVAIAEPDVGVLTRISLEHSEGLGDLESIEREEGAALAELGAGAVAIANVDDARCRARLAASGAQRRIGYGLASQASAASAAYRITRYAAVTQSTASLATVSAAAARICIERPRGAQLDLDSPLLGLPGAYAVAAAVAASEVILGRPLEPSEVAAALRSPELGEPGRLTPLPLADGSLVLDDTYNSSPASVLSSVEVARELAEQRRARLILVLGEMRELGQLSRAAHHEVGEGIVASSPAAVIAFGGDAESFLHATRRAGGATHFAPDAAAALSALARERRPGDVILVKASRSLHAERIVQGLASAAKGRLA